VSDPASELAVKLVQDQSPWFVSVLVPARNEAGNIGELVRRVAQGLLELDTAGELLVVDDGSTDATSQIAEDLVGEFPFLRVIRHKRNLGLTAALKTGFEAARGDVVLFLPGDLESDPAEDIPKLVGKLREGYDVVAGWRQGRRERKVFASAVYNGVSRLLFDVQVHDMNWIKGFRREVIQALPPLRSDWHRFILHIAAHQGFRIGEVRTNWYPRRSGRSKYGLSRIPKSLLDVLVIWFLLTFSQAPMRFFGGIGLACLVSSFLTYIVLAYYWFFRDHTQKRPIFWLAGGLALAGVVLVLVGFVAELVVSYGERLDRIERQLHVGRVDQSPSGPRKTES